MAMRAATMTQMNPREAYPDVRESDGLVRKLLLLVLLTTASVFLIVFLFKEYARLPLLLSTFFAHANLGLITGFGCRLVLNKRSLFFRSVMAILLVLLGMLTFGWLTNWILGVGPIALNEKVMDQLQRLTLQRDLFDRLGAMRIDWRTALDLRGLDWADPIHLALSVLMAGLALDAWTRTSPAEPIELAPSMPVTVTDSPTGLGVRTSASNDRARINLPQIWFPRLRPSPTPQRRTRSNGRTRSPVPTEAKLLREPVVRPKRRRSRRKPKIQFALIEEHRCPYCLDTVTRTDPRGVKECEVCHSLHHADCWAITGVCQVPHLNT